MSTPETNPPVILTPSLIEEARKALPGDWLSSKLAVASNHWRLKHEGRLREADMKLRALFLIAYREASKPKSASLSSFGVTQVSFGDLSALPSRRKLADDRYGEGFYAAVRAHTQVMVDQSPTGAPAELLLGLSEYLRDDAPDLSRHRGQAARALETIWEGMNVGWVN